MFPALSHHFPMVLPQFLTCSKVKPSFSRVKPPFSQHFIPFPTIFPAFPQRFPRGHKVLAMSCLKNEAQKSFEFRASSYPPADPHRCSGRATPHGRRSERGAQSFREPSPSSARFFWEISQMNIERSWKIQAAELKNVYYLLNQFSGFR